MCKPYSWCSMVAFFGLSSVLYRPIESLFPDTKSEYMNKIYNRIIFPRQNINNLSRCIIMWSSCSAEQFHISYQANHFVPVFKKKINNYESLPLQNSFIDLTILQDDKLSVIQDYLSINKLKDYNIYQEQSIIDDDIIDIIDDDDDIIDDDDDDVIDDNDDVINDDDDVINDDYDVINDDYDDNNYQSVVEQPIINEREQNLNLLGLLMRIDSSYVPNAENINGYLVYQEAKDFRFTIT
jgi:hypothetical protein